MSNQITMVDVLVKNIIPSFRKKYANINHFEFTDDGVTNVRIAFYHKGDEISRISMYEENCILEMDYKNLLFKVIKNRYASDTDVSYPISCFRSFVDTYISQDRDFSTSQNLVEYIPF